MNYRELLKKYMKHVGENEGIDYLRFVKPRHISEEEWKELLVLSLEPLLEDKSAHEAGTEAGRS